jgi:hypothetical protein
MSRLPNPQVAAIYGVDASEIVSNRSCDVIQL